MWTVVLSGPERTRAKAEVALEQARIPAPGATAWLAKLPVKFPGELCSWLVVEHSDVDAVVRAVEGADWRLRMHFETPESPPPSDVEILATTVAEMRAEIDALKAQVR